MTSMKEFVVISLGFLFLPSTITTSAQPATELRNDTDDQTRLLNLSVDLMDAVERKDQATLELLVA